MYNSFSSLGWLDNLSVHKRKAIEVISGDIRDVQRVREAMEGMDWVFHLAALVSIPYSYHSPSSYVSVNVEGTLNVLEAAKKASNQRTLITSTSEVYGSAKYVPIDEQHPLQSQSPYSASKIGAECLASAFWASFGTPISIVRPFNTYGPRQSPRAILPTIILQLLKGVDQLQLGALHPTRDLTYVTDTAEAMIQVMKTPDTVGEILNIASQTEISMGELANRLIEMIQPGTPLVQDSRRIRPSNSEVTRLLGSAKKLYDFTRWESRVSLEDGLQQCIEWYSRPEHLSAFQEDQYYV